MQEEGGSQRSQSSENSSSSDLVPPTSDFIVIATQRPETIMGDSGVCVNPNDERFAHLKGKKVIVPLVNRGRSGNLRRIC